MPLLPIPACPRKPTHRQPSYQTKTFQISLITPLFGGGFQAGIPDHEFPVRPSSIRGQLQFWWRATRGAQFHSFDQLFEAHAKIWGSTQAASPVSLTVDTGTPENCVDEIDHCIYAKTPFSYALFPFIDRKNKKPIKYISSTSFTLQLRFHETLLNDIETAVWAWVNFGGLGARTRRGCGALFCKELAPASIDDFKQMLRTQLTSLQTSQAQPWPLLYQDIWIGQPQESSAREAWKRAIGPLWLFRQGEGIGRANGPGRSFFPEAESIREITKTRSPKHPAQDQIPKFAFPRAEFGLPIVFHFPENSREPKDTVLYPAPFEDKPRMRMASPLILKPLALKEGGFLPLVLRLKTQSLDQVQLLDSKSSKVLAHENLILRGESLSTYSNSPLKSSTSDSALDAFCRDLEAGRFSRNRFTKVAL